MKTHFVQSGCNRVLLLLFFIMLFTPALSFAQKKKAGSLEYLKSCNGFKDIILGADISTVKYAKLNYLDDDDRFDADSCQKFAIADSALLKIDSTLSLDMVSIRTYKDKIVNIYLFFNKPDEYKILSNFLSAYGVFTSKPFEYKNIYNWDSRLVSLSLMYQADVEDGVAVFTCNPLTKYIADMKELAAMKARVKAIHAPDVSINSKKIFSSTNPDAVADPNK